MSYLFCRLGGDGLVNDGEKGGDIDPQEAQKTLPQMHILQEAVEPMTWSHGSDFTSYAKVPLSLYLNKENNIKYSTGNLKMLTI